MFGKRADGVRVKKLDAIFKLIPYIMKTRTDSQVFFEDRVYLDKVSEYIKKKKAEGIRITHMEIIIAAIGRLLYERPQLNRFIMNRQIYQRNETVISLAIKKQMMDEAMETTVKFKIKPEDTIFTIADQIKQVVEENKKVTTKNITDKLADFILSFPNFLIKGVVGIIMWMDKHNLLPKAVIDASPFHTSAFLTNLGSLGIDAIYHHIYDFGTTSIFFAMGGKKYEKDLDGNVQSYINIKVVADERICDGLYYAKSFLLLKRYLQKPELLEIPLNNQKEIKE